MNRYVAVAVAMLLPVVSGGAQRLTGGVRDSATSGAISGAVVVITDSADHLLARGLTDAAGKFSLELAPTARSLRVVRIGFRPRVVALAGLATRSPTNIAMQRLSNLLSAVVVNDDRVCSTRS